VRHVWAGDGRGGDGAAPSALAAAALHVRDDANAYGFGRNGSPTTGDRRNYLQRMRSESAARMTDGQAGGRADGRTRDTA